MDIEQFPCGNVTQIELNERPTAAQIAQHCIVHNAGKITTDEEPNIYYVMFGDGPVEEFSATQLAFLQQLAETCE